MRYINTIYQLVNSKIEWKTLFILIPTVAILNMILLYGLFMNPISQDIIFSKDYGQSSKLIAVWKQIEPIPSLTSLLPALLIPPIIYCILFRLFYDTLPGKVGMKKGFFFGIMLWCLIALFFELFTPFGLFGEPIHLLFYELMLWFVGFTMMGTIMGLVYDRISPKPQCGLI